MASDQETRGKLTIYVGAAPGVGKTFKMLEDANDWKAKGVDVVIGLIETHGRLATAQQILGLEVLPKRELMVQGRPYLELDVDAVIRRHPDVVLIDELAHTNVPGCERVKRYQDIEYIIRHGIDVVTAVNVQHLESLQDKVEHITGVKVRERVPDSFIDQAEELKLIDVSPETLQERLVEGKIYAPDKIERALTHFFQIGNLSALREIALLEVADDVDQRLGRARPPANPTDDAKPERILVCVNYRPHSEKLIRRGWRLADRLHAALYVLVVVSGRLTREEERDLERIEDLSQQFNATFLKQPVDSQGVGAVIVEVANMLEVTQIVIGQPQANNKGFLGRFQQNPIDYVLQRAEFVDLHVVANTKEGASA